MSSAVVVKREKRAAATLTTQEDKEIAEWAKRLAARPTPQIGTGTGAASTPTVGGQQTIHSYFGIQTPASGAVDASAIPPNNGFDLDSAIGRFTWHTISEDKYVPCLFRSGVKYCCIRMVEISVIGDLIRLLPPELYDCLKLETHNVTPVEAKLLLHINVWHCDGFYGSETFTTKDVIVRLDDVERFYNYLNFAYSVLSSGGRNDTKDFSNCGFLRVNNDNLIPYTVLSSEHEKGVPLFYFEGHTDCLKEKAVPLTGWELAYLKVCCKVQGVRKDLIAGISLQIIKVSELRAKFPKKTVFTEECWPTSKPKSLLSKTNGVNFGYPGSSTGSQSDKYTKCIPYNSGSVVSNNSKVSSSSSVSVSPQVTSTTTPSTSTSTKTSATVLSAPSVPVPPRISKNPPNSHTQQPQVGSQNPSTVINKNGGVNNNLTVRVANGVPSIPSGLQANSAALTKIKVPSPPHDTSRLQIIPENNDPYNRDAAYTVRLIIIDKQLMHCVNLRALKNEEYLIVLQEFMNHFFPSVSIYPTAVSVLKSCGITTYLPNSHQIRTLNNFGFSIQHNWQIPLVPAVDVTRAMSRLKTVFRPRNAVSAEAVINNSRNNGYTVMSSNTNHIAR